MVLILLSVLLVELCSKDLIFLCGSGTKSNYHSRFSIDGNNCLSDCLINSLSWNYNIGALEIHRILLLLLLLLLPNSTL